MEYYSTEDTKQAILALPIAVDANGNTLFHSEEWAKQQNIVIIYDSEGKGWIRGKDQRRFRVMVTGTDISKPFSKLTSGRN